MSAFTEYRVIIRPHAHLLEVSMDVRGSAPGKPLFLATPSWVPGAYGFMRYARDLYELKATDASGAPLAVTREGWTGFKISGATSDRVLVSYRASASDAAWGELSGLVDDEYAVLLGTRYLFAPDLGGRCRVRYE